MEKTNSVTIPTYLIKSTKERISFPNTLKQFHLREEFQLNIINRSSHLIDEKGLWHTLIRIIKVASKKNEDVIILCQNDHQFTTAYSFEYLLKNIIEANEQGACILIAGTNNFNHLIPLTQNRYWVDILSNLRFIIIYKRFFLSILKEPFCNADNVINKLSEMTSNKMLLFPFVSVKNPLYNTDVKNIINQTDVDLEQINERIFKIQRAYTNYKNRSINLVSNV